MSFIWFRRIARQLKATLNQNKHKHLFIINFQQGQQQQMIGGNMNPQFMQGVQNMGGQNVRMGGMGGQMQMQQQRMQMQQQMSQMNPNMQQRMQMRPGVNVQGNLRQILQQQQQQQQPQFQQQVMSGGTVMSNMQQQQQQMGGQQGGPRPPQQGGDSLRNMLG